MQDTTSLAARAVKTQVIVHPEGSAVYVSVDDMAHDAPRRPSIWKLKNVVVEESALLQFISQHRHSLQEIKFEKVSIQMAGAAKADFQSRVSRWTTIIDCIATNTDLHILSLICQGWHDPVDNVAISKCLEILYPKYLTKFLDPLGMQYWRFSDRTMFEARGSRAIRLGLEKMVEEVQKPWGPSCWDIVRLRS